MTRRGELDRVGDQIRDDLLQANGVRFDLLVHEAMLRLRARPPRPPPRDRRLRRRARPRPGGTPGADAHGELPRDDPRDVEEIGESAELGPAVRSNRLERPAEVGSSSSPRRARSAQPRGWRSAGCGARADKTRGTRLRRGARSRREPVPACSSRGGSSGCERGGDASGRCLPRAAPGRRDGPAPTEQERRWRRGPPRGP